MESKRTATTYFIPPGKFLLMENALGNPDLIQSSVSSDCRVTIVDSANFPLDELEQWPTFRLTSADIKLKLGDGAYYIYIVVPTPDNTESTSAFISYNTALVDRDGYEVIETEDEEGNPKLEKGELLGKSGFKYYQCGVISARGENSSAITAPAGQGRLLSVDLGVNPQDANLEKKVDWDFFYSLFKPHYDDPKDPTKLTWIEVKSHMGIQGGAATFIEGEGMDLPSIYDGLPIDNQTLIWEDINGVRVLKARGVGSGEGGEIMPSYLGDLQNVGSWANGVASEDRLMIQRKGYSDWESISLSSLTDSVSFENVKEGGSGNAYTSFSLSSDKKTLTFNKGKEFAEKSNSLKGYGITDAYTKTEADELLAKKWTADNAKIQNWDTAFGWGDHNKAGYALKTYVDKNFIGIKGDYTIEGTKNFVGSLQVNGSPIVYNEQYGYWKLEGDLVITGGIASFSSDMAYDPISIMDGILTDDVTIRVNKTTKKLEVIGGGGGGSDGAKVKIVSVGDSMDEPNTLYVVV